MLSTKSTDARSSKSLAKMTTVCQKCGVKGYSDLLIYCIRCQVSAEHRYCLHKLPKTKHEAIMWACEECVPNVAKLGQHPSRKSDRISVRKDRLDKVRMARKEWRKEKSSPAVKAEVYIKEKMPEAAKLSATNEAMNPCPGKGTRGDQELERWERKLVLDDESSSDEESESNKVRMFGKNWQNEKSDPAFKAEVFMQDKMPEAGKLTSDLSATNEEARKLCSGNGTYGNQKLKRRTRKLILEDESSSDEESESIKVSMVRKKWQNEKNAPAVQAKVYRKEEIPEAGKLTSDLLATNEVVGKLCSGNGTCRTEELKRRKRKLIVDDQSSDEEPQSIKVEAPHSVLYASDRQLNISHSLRSLESSNGVHAEPVISYVHAQPIIDPIWRGCFKFGNENNEKYGAVVGLAAHLSSKACLKVCDVAADLPPMLDIQILPRSNAWPKSFHRSPPTDDSIALYFFPEYERDEIVFDGILDDIIDHNLALKAVINNVELLVFSSLELPEQHWRFRRKYYLWGAFRQKQDSFPLKPNDCMIQNSDVASAESVMHFKPPNDIRSPEERGLRSTLSPRSILSTSSSSFSGQPHSPFHPSTTHCSADLQYRQQDNNDRLEAFGADFPKHKAAMPQSDGGNNLTDPHKPFLELFPLEVEDIAIVKEVERRHRLDLELGLGH